MKPSLCAAVMQKGSKSLSGPAFSDQNKSWLKRKQEADGDSDDLEDELDDLQDNGLEGQHMLSDVCQYCWWTWKHHCKHRGSHALPVYSTAQSTCCHMLASIAVGHYNTTTDIGIQLLCTGMSTSTAQHSTAQRSLPQAIVASSLASCTS